MLALSLGRCYARALPRDHDICRKRLVHEKLVRYVLQTHAFYLRNRPLPSRQTSIIGVRHAARENKDDCPSLVDHTQELFYVSFPSFFSRRLRPHATTHIHELTLLSSRFPACPTRVSVFIRRRGYSPSLHQSVKPVDSPVSAKNIRETLRKSAEYQAAHPPNPSTNADGAAAPEGDGIALTAT